MRRAFGVLCGAALALALGFLALPLLAIFLRVGPGEIVEQLGTEQAVEAILVSLRTSAIAHGVVLVVGTPAAYLIASHPDLPGRALLITLVELPLVLPPAVAGIGLFAAFGRQGLLGDELEALGLRIPFTQLAVVMAVVFVSSPFYLRAAISAFEAVPRELAAAARTLGAGPWRVFRRVALPLALGGLGAGSTLAFARGLGEFGATILFAGSFPARTQTLPLAVYAEFNRAGGLDTALAIGALLVVLSIALLLSTKLVPRWTRSGSTWPSRSATSPSGSAST